jgi:hypothetical protein
MQNQIPIQRKACLIFNTSIAWIAAIRDLFQTNVIFKKLDQQKRERGGVIRLDSNSADVRVDDWHAAHQAVGNDQGLMTPHSSLLIGLRWRPTRIFVDETENNSFR